MVDVLCLLDQWFYYVLNKQDNQQKTTNTQTWKHTFIVLLEVIIIQHYQFRMYQLYHCIEFKL